MKEAIAKPAQEPSPAAKSISIIGCGNVGTTCAYALLLNPLVRHLILIDHDLAAAEGEAMDLQHAVLLDRQ